MLKNIAAVSCFVVVSVVVILTRMVSFFRITGVCRSPFYEVTPTRPLRSDPNETNGRLGEMKVTDVLRRQGRHLSTLSCTRYSFVRHDAAPSRINGLRCKLLASRQTPGHVWGSGDNEDVILSFSRFARISLVRADDFRPFRVIPRVRFAIRALHKLCGMLVGS